MNWNKSVRCQLLLDSPWAAASAACMGLSVFVRAVYYFGLTNLRDLGSFDLAAQVVLPLVLAAVYLAVLRIPRLCSPVFVGSAMAAFAVSNLLAMERSAMGILSTILLVLTAAVFLATALGYVPMRHPVMALGAITLVLRFLAVDLFGCILPLSQFRVVAYLPELSTLFGIAAVCVLCPGIQLTKLTEPEEIVNP